MEQTHDEILKGLDSQLRKKANKQLAGVALAVAIFGAHTALAFDMVNFGDYERSVTGYIANYVGMVAGAVAISWFLHRYKDVSQTRRKLMAQS